MFLNVYEMVITRFEDQNLDLLMQLPRNGLKSGCSIGCVVGPSAVKGRTHDSL